MIDSVALKLADNSTPKNTVELIAFLLVLGVLLGWVAYLYFNSKKGGSGSVSDAKKDSDRQRGDSTSDEGYEWLQREITQGFERLERVVDKLESKFDTQIRDVKSELKSELAELRNAYAASVHEKGAIMAVVGELKGRVESLRNKNDEKSGH